MNVLDLLKDGALAAAELSALLLVAPASAADGPTAASPAYERPVQLHRLAVAGDNGVLGALAQARITRQGASDSEPPQRTPQRSIGAAARIRLRYWRERITWTFCNSTYLAGRRPGSAPGRRR